MKILFIILLIMIGSFVFYKWDSSTNRGNSRGYYGEFNRVSNVLASIPEVTTETAWYNADVSLEEFGFGISVTGRQVKLSFAERDLIRTMSPQKARTALGERIKTELSLQTNR